MTHEKQVVGKCIKCEEEISRVTTGDGITLHEYDGAAEVQIQCGYGSSMDLTEFKAMICDACLEDMMRKGLIPEYRRMELMGPDLAFREDLDWSDIDGLFSQFKDLWEQRSMSNEGREINRKLLEDRNGKYMWPEGFGEKKDGTDES